MRAHPLGHLLLEHAHDLHHGLLLVQNLEQNLRGDVVREIADNHLRAVIEIRQRILQEVTVNQVVTQFRIVNLQIVNGFLVQLDDGELRELALQELLCQHPHTRSDLYHLCVGRADSVGDVLRNRLVIQKMLS